MTAPPSDHQARVEPPRRRLYLVSLAVWVGLLLIAIVNGAVREFLLVRLIGPAALPVSGLIAMAAFTVVIAAFVRASRPPVAVAARIGGLWLAITLVMETVLTVAAGRTAGDVAAALSPSALMQGNLLLPLLLLTALAPAVCARLLTPRA
jgi:hypothetical protein